MVYDQPIINGRVLKTHGRLYRGHANREALRSGFAGLRVHHRFVFSQKFIADEIIIDPLLNQAYDPPVSELRDRLINGVSPGLLLTTNESQLTHRHRLFEYQEADDTGYSPANLSSSSGISRAFLCR
jgi:hypothetical protein